MPNYSLIVRHVRGTELSRNGRGIDIQLSIPGSSSHRNNAFHACQCHHVQQSITMYRPHIL